MNAPRFELVRTNAGWHSRFIAGNGRQVWTTEVYKRSAGAENAVVLLLDALGGHFGKDLEVREIDDRYVPPPVVLEPPFYVRPKSPGPGVFWHDRDYHWRHCTDECTEGTPPPGVEVRGRMGSAVPA